MLAIGERQNYQLARSISNSVFPEFTSFLGTLGRLDRRQQISDPLFLVLDRTLRSRVKGLAVLKVQIYNAKNQTLYSTNTADIGVVREKDYPGGRAIRSGHPVSALDFRSTFESLQGSIRDRHVLSTYVPINESPGKAANFVLEVYVDVTSDIATINRAQITVLAGSAGVLFLVFVAMYVAARRADNLLSMEAELSQQAMEASSRLGAIVDQSINEVYIFSRGSLKFIQVNKGALRNLGYGWDELSEMTPYDIKPEYSEQDFRAAIAPLLSGELKQLFFETIHQRKDGSTYPVDVRLQLSSVGDDSVFVAMIMDTTEQKAAESRISFLAYHDELTELPNRNLFLDRLQQALFDADREEHLVAVMFLDIDRFKNINDSLGHTAGDKLLIEAARRLKQVLRTGDTVSRFGGDEFSVLLSGVHNVADCTLVADKIMERMMEPFLIDGKELVVTVSIGITLYPFDDGEVDGLLKNADIAMYHAKEAGRNNYQFYSSAMAQAAADRMGIELSLRHALINDELVVHYQPIQDIASGEIVGVESLVRWQHPDQGLIAPDKFIGIAEETGLIVPVGNWVLRTACEQIQALGDVGRPSLRLAVNLSPRQFRGPTLIQDIEEIFHATGFDPSRLDLEITEGLLMDDHDLVKDQLDRLTSAGIKLSIDDFGTGYSSLGYLKRLPINNLKIDRSFVDDLSHDRDDAAIVSSIISMAHYLGLKTVAEGVENPEQFAFLKQAGCDQAQGYLIEKPMPIEQLRLFLMQYKSSESRSVRVK